MSKLSKGGLLKLSEECGELVQIAMKTAEGQKVLRQQLEDEIADVLACIDVVSDVMYLDHKYIETRRNNKRTLFMMWGVEGLVK